MPEPTRPLSADARPVGSPWPIPDAAAFLSVSARHLHRLLDARKVASPSGSADGV